MSSVASDVSARIGRLEDRREILRLFMDYGRLLDTKDWAPYSELFAATGQLVSSSGVGAATGPAEIRQLFDETLKDVPVGARHVFSNISVDIDDSTATARSMWMYVTSGENQWPRVLQFGRYDDTIVREDGRWKFQKREITRAIGFPPYKR